MGAKNSAGYAGTPLPKKLGIVEGARVLVVSPPKDFDATLGELPVGVRRVRGSLAKDLDVAVLFATDRAAMNGAFAATTPKMKPAGGVWIAWPKRASGVETDITEDAIREDLLPTGWVDNKVCAVDETWSALRMVLRKELRPKR